MALPEFPMISVEDYLTLDRTSKEARYEYIDGELRMLAGGSTHHSIIIANLTGILYGSLRGNPCRAYNSDIRLQLSESRYVYPDITISCDQRDRELNDTIRYPHVIVEVLSPSTEANDRGRKFAYYRECPTLQEYIMVDSQKMLIEVYRRQEEGWMLHPFGQRSTVELKSLNIHFPIEDAYEGVTLTRNP